MERREVQETSPRETAPSRNPRWQNIDFMLATFPFAKIYLHGGTPFSSKEVASFLYKKADAGVGLGLLWLMEAHLLAYGAGEYFMWGVTSLAGGVTNLAHGISRLGARAWRVVKPPSF